MAREGVFKCRFVVTALTNSGSRPLSPCASLLLAVSSPALASSSVVVLGLRSIEGDDEVANDLTEQLRKAARSTQGWSVSTAAVLYSPCSVIPKAMTISSSAKVLPSSSRAMTS